MGQLFSSAGKEAGSDAAANIKEGTQYAADKAADATTHATDKGSEAAHEATEALKDTASKGERVAQDALHTVDSVADKAQDTAQHLANNAQSMAGNASLTAERMTLTLDHARHRSQPPALLQRAAVPLHDIRPVTARLLRRSGRTAVPCSGVAQLPLASYGGVAHTCAASGAAVHCFGDRVHQCG